MLMPGRNGHATSDGWASSSGLVNGYSVPGDLTVDHRDIATTEYTASNSIEFLPGFESALSDNFDARIADASYNGSSGSSGSSGSGNKDNSYRYGFNGKEMDNELYGDGNQYDFGARIQDPRLGRWLSTDPLQTKYAGLSPYSYVNNSPILMIDNDGKDFEVYIDEKNKTITIKATFYTDNSRITYNQALAAVNYINSASDKYDFQTSAGETYKIKMEMNVIPIKIPALGENIKTQNMAAALNDDAANFIENSSSLPLGKLADGQVGVTTYGGDRILTFSASGDIWGPVREDILKNWGITGDLNEFDKQTKAHEILHALGLDHSLIGKEGASINEDVIGAILQYASEYNKMNDSKIEVDGVKNKWLLKISKALDSQLSNQYNKDGVGSRHQPRASIKSDSDAKLEIKGKVSERKKDESKTE